MAKEILEMEARLKNFVTKETDKIMTELKKVDKTAKTSFGNADKAASGFMNTLKGFIGASAIIGTARKAWSMLNQLAKESIELYKVQEQAVQRLNVSVGDTTDELVEYAAALQKTTTFGDEEIISAQALVASFIREESQIKKLIPAILDFAAAKQFKLAAAADLVTKTVASETNALTRYGLAVEGAAGSTERIESAVNALNTAFGGTAEAIAKIDTGQLEQIENRIGDIKEGIGEDVLPLYLEWQKAQEQILKGIGAIVKAVATGPIATLKKQIEESETPLTDIALKREEIEKNIARLMRGGSGKLQQENALALLKIEEDKLKVLEEIEIKEKGISSLRAAFDAQQKRRKSEKTEAPETDPEAAKKAAEEIRKIEREKRLEHIKSMQAILTQRSQMADEEASLAEKAAKESVKIEQQKSQQILDARMVLADAMILQIDSEGDRELAALDLRYERMLETIKGNEEAITIIKKAAKMERDELLAQLDEEAKRERYEREMQGVERVLAAQNMLADNIIALSRQKRQQELADERAKIRAMNITEGQKAKLLKQAEERSREAAQREKGIAIAMSIINTALGVTKELSQWGVYGIITGALVAAAGAVEVATIAQQNFQQGGIVAGTNFSGDSNLVGTNSGEMFLNRQQQGELFALANGRGTTNNASLSVSFNVAPGGNLDSVAADRIVESVEGLGKALEDANRAGALDDFKSMVGLEVV